MRKLTVLWAVLISAVCCQVDAQAFEVKHKWLLSGNGGVAIPLGDFADDDSSNAKAGGASTGFGFGVALEYGVTEQVLVGGRFAFSRFGVSDKLIADPDISAHWNVLEIFGLYGKYLVSTSSNTRPYGRAGLFLGKPELSVDGDIPGWSGDYDVSVGFEAALGVKHQVSNKLCLGLEARFATLSLNESESDSMDEAAVRSASVTSPHGVRDPGGNIKDFYLNGSVDIIF